MGAGRPSVTAAEAAADHGRTGDAADPCAHGDRQARGEQRGAALHQLEDPAALRASVAERDRCAAGPLRPWAFEGSFRAGAAGAARRGRVRLPRRALAGPADDGRDREQLRDSEAPDAGDEGPRLENTQRLR
jgi:hypothetical protein